MASFVHSYNKGKQLPARYYAEHWLYRNDLTASALEVPIVQGEKKTYRKSYHVVVMLIRRIRNEKDGGEG